MALKEKKGTNHEECKGRRNHLEVSRTMKLSEEQRKLSLGGDWGLKRNLD